MELFLNGRYCTFSEARVSALDRGFLFGDGIFTTIKVERTQPLLLNRHLHRLESSCTFWNIQFPKLDFADIIRTLLSKNKVIDARAKILISRGCDTENRLFTYQSNQPSVAVFLSPLAAAPSAVSLITQAYFRGDEPLYRHKTISYLQNLYYKGLCRNREADDCIITDYREVICETSTANLFFVTDGGIITPPASLPLLNGVMRQELLERGSVGSFHISEAVIKKSDLAEIEAAFVTSAILEICPVKQIDGRILPVELPEMVRRHWLAARREP